MRVSVDHPGYDVLCCVLFHGGRNRDPDTYFLNLAVPDENLPIPNYPICYGVNAFSSYENGDRLSCIDIGPCSSHKQNKDNSTPYK